MARKRSSHDILGKTFGRLTVTAKGRPSYWVCQCSCGNVTEAIAAKLVSGHTKSCGCWRRDHPPDVPIKDRTGQRFSRLVALECVGRRGGQALWRCRCDCGKLTDVVGSNLFSGGTKSCGCMVLDIGKYPGHRAWQAKNRDEFGASSLRALYGSYSKHAAQRGLAFALDFQQFAEIVGRACAYCGLEPAQTHRVSKRCNGGFVYNGIDRIDNALGYVVGNIATACKQCNYAKRDSTLAHFNDWVRRVYARLGTVDAQRAS